MTRRHLWALAVVGVVLLAVFLALVLSWAWALLPPGVFCLFLFVTAEDAGAEAPRR